jgi:hypothetical protein
MQSKEQKRREALERQALIRTPEEQLARLDKMKMVAVKERAKLAKRIAANAKKVAKAKDKDLELVELVAGSDAEKEFKAKNLKK